MHHVHIHFPSADKEGECRSIFMNERVSFPLYEKLWQLIRFAVVTGIIFIGIFSLINFSAYKQIVLDTLNPQAQKTAQVALEKVVGADSSASLSLLPILSVKKKESQKHFSYDFPVTPTDHRLIIPKLGKNIPVVEMDTGALNGEDWPALEKQIQSGLQKGVVHYPGTAKPNEFGNVFITGHSSFYPWDPGKFKDVFARLGKLEIGEEFYLYYDQKRYAYQIIGKKEVPPTDVSVLKQPRDKKILTLMTCVPVGTTLRRLIITAAQV
ncbi:sortase [Candidatus Peregrinibacteria bacterium]|nr:sortase [Candidatus Peregrinibacteria bacterium]